MPTITRTVEVDVDVDIEIHEIADAIQDLGSMDLEDLGIALRKQLSINDRESLIKGITNV